MLVWRKELSMKMRKMRRKSHWKKYWLESSLLIEHKMMMMMTRLKKMKHSR